MKLECCADVISFYQSSLVLVERLGDPKGLALPGGRLDPEESLEQCAVRELKEETGLDLKLDYQFRTYSEPDRDPRGRKVSTVFVGEASGIPRDEQNKTKVVLFDLDQIEQYKDYFAFDHYRVLKDYQESREVSIDRYKQPVKHFTGGR